MGTRIENYILSLKDIEIASAQIWGPIRLVPLIRKHTVGDLRLGANQYSEIATVVSLKGELMDEGVKYISYIPHAMIATWSDDGKPLASWGTQLYKKKDGKILKNVPIRVGRMAKRLSDNQLRFLPLHLAMEGYLSLHFNGPEIVWEEYSRQAVSSGLDPRSEYTIPGKMISKLDEALRVFEIHEGQTGLLLFVGDALASAFIVPHPDDYRKLHQTLIEDFYGELLYYYSMYSSNLPVFKIPLSEKEIYSISDIGKAVEDVCQEIALFKKDCMANGLFSRNLHVEQVYQMGRFSLKRFIPDLKLNEDNHIGEFIVSDKGTLEYLKTYRLSRQQTKRAYLLRQLSIADWNLFSAAANLGLTYEQLVERLCKAGFGFLMRWGKVEEKIKELNKIKKK